MNNTRPKTQKRANRQQSFLSETRNILKHVQVDNRIYRRRLIFQGLVTADAIGTIATAFLMNPNGASDWASCASLYDEFRVVGIAINLVPLTTFSITALQGLVLVVYDNDDSAIITSYEEGLEYATTRLFPSVWTTNHVQRYSFARPSAGNETALPWIDVGAPGGSTGAIKIYAFNLTTLTSYFRVVIEWAVEFRGIR